MNKKYNVYIHIFPNNKTYIGITCQEPKDRWNNGNGYKQQIYLYRAIRKYGWNNIEHKILFANLTEKEAQQKEIELIAKYKSNNMKYGYNISNGGFSGNKHSESTKEKIRNSLKGHTGYMLGKHMTEEAKEKISKAFKGRKLSEQHKQNLRISHLGKKHSEEQKRKIAISNMKKVMCIETGIIYNSITEAEKITKQNHKRIIGCCKGKLNPINGYHWKYVLKDKGDEINDIK